MTQQNLLSGLAKLLHAEEDKGETGGEGILLSSETPLLHVDGPNFSPQHPRLKPYGASTAIVSEVDQCFDLL